MQFFIPCNLIKSCPIKLLVISILNHFFTLLATVTGNMATVTCRPRRPVRVPRLAVVQFEIDQTSLIVASSDLLSASNASNAS